MAAELSKRRVDLAGERLCAFLADTSLMTPDQLIAELRHLIDWRRQHAYPIRLVIPSLRNWTAKHSTANITPAERLKREPQIILKLRRHPGMKLSRMQDIAGARAIFANPDEVERVHRLIVKRWQPVRTSDYRDQPRDTGYRGLHLIVAKRRSSTNPELRLVEIQLRTLTEHQWAEAVMATGNRLRHRLQDGQGPGDLVEYFRLASDVLYARARGIPIDDELDSAFGLAREQVRQYFS